MSAYTRELEVAVQAARDAGRVCRAVQQGIDPEALQKKDRSPVTVADYSSQALVCRALQAEFPDDPVVAEEGSADLRTPERAAFLDQVVSRLAEFGAPSAEQTLAWIDHGGAPGGGDRFWTLDPVDGTKGFLRGEQYAVALALLERGEIVVAVLACPNLGVGSGRGALFVASAGQGATVQPLFEASEPTAIRVSPTQDPAQARFCESVEAAHSSHGQAAEVAAALGITRDSLRLDSQAKYGVVARGDAEIYLRLPTRADYREKIWDHAAGALIVAEAGGVVTDIAGRRLDFAHGRRLEHNRGVVVANAKLHERLIAALRDASVG